MFLLKHFYKNFKDQDTSTPLFNKNSIDTELDINKSQLSNESNQMHWSKWIVILWNMTKITKKVFHVNKDIIEYHYIINIIPSHKSTRVRASPMKQGGKMRCPVTIDEWGEKEWQFRPRNLWVLIVWFPLCT